MKLNTHPVQITDDADSVQQQFTSRREFRRNKTITIIESKRRGRGKKGALEINMFVRCIFIADNDLIHEHSAGINNRQVFMRHCPSQTSIARTD